MLFNRSSIVDEEYLHVASNVRTAVDLNPPDESRVWLVHDDISWSNLLENMLIHVTIVRMYHNQIIHIVELVEVVHIFEVVDDNLFFLDLFDFSRLHLD